MRRALSLSAVLLLLWAGLCLAATEITCIVDTDPDAEDAHYHSLAAAIAGEAGASPKCVTSADLVANDEQLKTPRHCHMTRNGPTPHQTILSACISHTLDSSSITFRS